MSTANDKVEEDTTQPAPAPAGDTPAEGAAEESKRVPRRKRHGARHRARRRAVDILYEAENRDTDPVDLVAERTALHAEDPESIAPIADYTRQIVRGVAEELDAIDDAIERYLSADWELHRIPAVDRAILRVSVWELQFNPEIPAPIGVVEGVELASEYSEPSAAAYINALLDDVAQAAREDSPMSEGTTGAEADSAAPPASDGATEEN